ncbi:helix-turn-helix domain-containing protein [Saccharothrix lopnurensis]|uniref:Helix-turn-helix domain-containing protein n=1 Tax=Saccharothrix lopnurensis TaxID=1670621 RepID=A0ABW1P9U7_9PSEU
MSTARSRELGEELRRVRREANLSSGWVSEALGWSLGKLSKLETGSRGTSAWEIGTLVGRCGADKATRDRILALVAEPDTGSFLRPHHTGPDDLTALTLHEVTATSITVYEPLTVPALVQTEAYALALTGDEDLVSRRRARQEALALRRGPHLTVYLHENALRHLVGDADVMRDQLLRLTSLHSASHTTVRVVPATAVAHPALSHPAALLTFPHPQRPLAYTETDLATVFHDDSRMVTRLRDKMRHLARLAVGEQESGKALVRWADSYERRIR